jgi:hypothetical protein
MVPAYRIDQVRSIFGLERCLRDAAQAEILIFTLDWGNGRVQIFRAHAGDFGLKSIAPQRAKHPILLALLTEARITTSYSERCSSITFLHKQ